VQNKMQNIIYVHNKQISKH